jgi:fatty-acyl-CoA synthase
VTTLTAFMKGAEVVLHRGFDPGRWIEDVVKYKVTTAFAVPAMLLAVSHHPAFASSDLSCMRMIICGGAPVPEPLLKLYAKRGLPINQGYGLTETAPMVTFLTSEWGEAKLGSAGRSGFFVDVALMDADGKFLKEPMARGEVVARGPNVMKGYWNKPEATDAAIDAAGWFHTGDVGYFDTDGFLYICDRVKDMVITGGENVYLCAPCHFRNRDHRATGREMGRGGCCRRRSEARAEDHARGDAQLGDRAACPLQAAVTARDHRCHAAQSSREGAQV